MVDHAVMPWVPRTLRGQRVLARCEHDGTLRVEDGRVEIRYRPRDGRSYRARPSNLEPTDDATIFPDEHCGAAEEPATGSRAARRASRADITADARSERADITRTTGRPVVTVYADGACSGNPGPAGLGVVVYDEHETRELSEYLGRATNNIAELTAILRAVRALAGETRPVLLKTDSQYAIGVLTKGWKAKANPDLVAEVKAALAQVPSLAIRYVEGHAGHAGNERADALARAAVESRRTTGWVTRRRAHDVDAAGAT